MLRTLLGRKKYEKAMSVEHPQSVREYGIPSHIRADKGGEFVHVKCLMNFMKMINERASFTIKK